MVLYVQTNLTMTTARLQFYLRLTSRLFLATHLNGQSGEHSLKCLLEILLYEPFDIIVNGNMHSLFDEKRFPMTHDQFTTKEIFVVRELVKRGSHLFGTYDPIGVSFRDYCGPPIDYARVYPLRLNFVRHLFGASLCANARTNPLHIVPLANAWSRVLCALMAQFPAYKRPHHNDLLALVQVFSTNRPNRHAFILRNVIGPTSCTYKKCTMCTVLSGSHDALFRPSAPSSPTRRPIRSDESNAIRYLARIKRYYAEMARRERQRKDDADAAREKASMQSLWETLSTQSTTGLSSTSRATITSLLG